MDTRTRQKVDEGIKHHAKNPIGRDNLEEKLIDEYSITREDVQDRVSVLIRQGTLFEPESGKVKVLRT